MAAFKPQRRAWNAAASILDHGLSEAQHLWQDLGFDDLPSCVLALTQEARFSYRSNQRKFEHYTIAAFIMLQALNKIHRKAIKC